MNNRLFSRSSVKIHMTLCLYVWQQHYNFFFGVFRCLYRQLSVERSNHSCNKWRQWLGLSVANSLDKTWTNKLETGLLLQLILLCFDGKHNYFMCQKCNKLSKLLKGPNQIQVITWKTQTQPKPLSFEWRIILNFSIIQLCYRRVTVRIYCEFFAFVS